MACFMVKNYFELIKRWVVALFVIVPSVALGESTNTQKLSRIQFDGTKSTVYFVGEGRWSSTSCANATYAYARDGLPGRDQILSIALAAHMSGKKVTFWGVCDETNNDYFIANYIIVHQD